MRLIISRHLPFAIYRFAMLNTTTGYLARLMFTYILISFSVPIILGHRPVYEDIDALLPFNVQYLFRLT
jgi:hypothetical protein